MKQILVQSVGIDVSKYTLATALLSVDHSTKIKTFANTNKGVGALIKFINKHETAATVPCVIESTGDYHLRCALMVSGAGYAVNLINPLITKQYQRASVRNSKDDSVDAVRLARIGIMEPNLYRFNATPQRIMLKKVVASLGKLATYKQQLEAHLRQLQETQKLLGVKIDCSGLKKTIAALETQEKLFEQYVHTNAPKEAVSVADATRGVSQTRVAMLLSALEGKTFAHRDQLTAFVGLDVAARRSGTWKGREKISKRGDPHLRKLLFQMAWGLKQHNVVYKEYYERLRKDGKHYFTCLVAVARKFLRFLFVAIWKKPTLAC
jgi:transposase